MWLWVTTVVQSLNHVQCSVTPWTVHTGLLLSSIPPWICSNSCPLSRWCYLCHTVMPPSLIISIFQHRGLSSKSALHIRWPKYWRFHFSISPSNEDSGLIYFRMDWFDLPAVQGTLKSLLQQYKWKASIPHSAFFMVQLTSTHDYWKTIALTIGTCVPKWHLCFLIHCRGLSSLPRSKCFFNFMASVTIHSDFGAPR